MKRALWVALMVVLLLGVLAFAPQSAKAWGPCNGPYGGYAGCNYYGGSSAYTGGYVYNRVCFWSYYWYYPHLVCIYVRVPAYPVSGVYNYMPSYGYGGMSSGYGGMSSGYGGMSMGYGGMSSGYGY